MKHLPQISSIYSTRRRKLCLAIAAQMLLSAGVKAAPAGGAIVGGDGTIDQAGLNTTVIQNSDRLAIDWESFNIAADERVQFIQPDASSIALNRIIGNEASQIFGRLDANGHVILMNPNGVLFGENASINVGGLVASGLAINSADFMNGEFVLSAVEGADGIVVNKGIINASTGGSIALVGRHVENQGLISANLGSVTLAASKEAVLTFDNQGLLGVRVSREILQSELGVEAAVSNSGEITAEGGRILLTASVSQDIFSQAVNAEGLNAKTSVVMHQDGSFTLGAGADVINTGTLTTSSVTMEAGDIVVLGENVNSSGAILANSKAANAAGNIEIHSRDTTLLTGNSTISAINEGAGSGGQIKILGDRIGVLDQSQIHTSGTRGGGDINIGGGFQGKVSQLRNATRTVIGKNTLIEANAINNGDAGDVIVWADKTTSFTGEINARGGALGGDGGFVEVSGKENLRFLGSVDRTAVRGENGTLLLDPETVVIVPEQAAVHDDDIADGVILFSDEPDDGSSVFLISDIAIARALATGDVFISATDTIGLYDNGLRIVVDDPNSTSSLVLESGDSVYLSGEVELDLGLGDFVAVGTIERLCQPCAGDDNITLFAYGTINTKGNIYLFSSTSSVFHSSVVGTNQTGIPNNIYMYSGGESVFSLDADLEVTGAIKVETLERPTLTSITLPSGAIYEIPELRDSGESSLDTAFITTSPLEGKAEVIVGEGLFIDANLADSNGVRFSEIIVNSRSQDGQLFINSRGPIYLPEIGHGASRNLLANTISVSASSSADIYVDQDISTWGGALQLKGANLNFGESVVIDTAGVANQGNIYIESAGDINLGQILSGSDLEVTSTEGSIVANRQVVVAGQTRLNAQGDISFSETSVFLPEKNVFLTAGNDIHFETSSDMSDPGFLTLAPSNAASFIFNAGRNVIVESTLVLGLGDFIASAGTKENSPSDFPVPGSIPVIRAYNGPGIYAKAIDTNGKIIFRSSNFIDSPVLESGSNGSGGFIGYYTNGSVALPYYANSNGNFEVYNYAGAENLIAEYQLSDGSTIELPDIAFFESANSGYVGWYSSGADTAMATSGGDLYIEAKIIQHWGAHAVDVSSSTGHGNITFIAEEEITAPLIVYSNTLFQGADESSEIQFSAKKIRIDRDFDFNNSGAINFQLNAEGDIVLGVIEGDEHYQEVAAFNRREGGRIFDSAGGDKDQINIQINSGGTAYQKYDIFTGGGNYLATATQFNFNEGVQINTDFSNDTENSLSGVGNISLIETVVDPLFFQRFILPDIQTQADCSGESSCGDLNIVSSRSIYDGEPADDVQRTIIVSGNANFETGGHIDLFGEGNDIQFDGSVSVKAGTISLETRGGFELSDWEVSGTLHIAVQETEGRSSDLISNSTLTGGAVVIGTPGELILKGEQTRFSARAELHGSRIELNHQGDLLIGEIFLTGGSLAEASLIEVNGDVLGSEGNTLDIAGKFVDGIYQDASPVIFDVNGDLLLTSADNKISSIQILNANTVALQNSSNINLAGIKAENLSLNILGDITQTSAINITGETSIIAAANSNIDLSNVLNDFNTVNIQAAAPATIEIADLGSISLADIYVNGAGSSSSLTVVAANILQADNGRILLQDGAELNLQGDYISLGANGTASVDINGAVLNSLFSGDLSITGVVRGRPGTADSRFAGLYFEGDGTGNFFEVAAGGSIVGDFREDSRIFLGDGNDVANIAGDIAVSVDGGAGNDIFTISSSGIRIEQILGSEGSDILNGPAAEAIWTITANGEGNVISGNAETRFNGIERFFGGSGADSFVVESVTTPLELSGGLGANSLSANPNDDTVDNQWIIDSINSGSLNELISFSAIESLFGNGGADRVTFLAGARIGSVSTGLGDDTFILAAGIAADLLDAGDGQDTLNLNGINSIYTYLNELISGDGNYIATGFEVESNEGGSKTVVGVDGYDAEWIIDDEGSVLVNAQQNGITQTNRFVGVTRLEGASGNDTFILRGGYVEDRILGGQGGTDTLVADTSDENTWSISASNSGAVAFGAGGEQVFDAIANLVGGSGDDLFNILSGADFDGTIRGALGTNSIAILDSAASSLWTIAATNNVRVESENGTVSEIRFSDIQSLIGSDNNDTFSFTGASDVTAIQGGAGDNNLVWRAGDLAVDLGSGSLNQQIQFSRINAFDAEATASNTLIGADEDNAWTLAGNASGTLTSPGGEVGFTGFHTLVGGTAVDSFALAANAGGFIGVDGGAGEDSISAADILNEWRLDSAGGELNGMRFSNLEALLGGAQQDNFVLITASSQAQTIDGGAGANRLTGYDQANAWNVTGDNAGDLTGLASFRNIQTLIGGSQADTFTLAAGVNLSEIYAGAGNDVFVIGTGVIADNFYGEAGDDSFDVGLGLELSGVLDGGNGGETEGDFIDLGKFTLLDATADLESVVGFSFRNFERIEQPNNQGIYFGGNGTNVWYITGANEGRLEIREGEKAGVYEFSGVHSLLGGEGTDIFIFANDAAAVSTLIDGGTGAGANTLDLSAQGLINRWLLDGANSGSVINSSNTNGNVFTNITYLIGGSNRDLFELHAGGSIAGAIDGGLGADEFTVEVDQSSNWLLGGAGGHSVTGVASFTNIESLIGGSGVDNFDILASLTDVTQLTGGAGSDAVNFLYDSPVSVELARGLAGGLRVEGIERYTAIGAGSTLIGADSTTTWTVDGADRGSIRYLVMDGGEALNVAFDGFGNLAGGVGDDQFLFATGGSVSGAVTGGGGRNRVDLQALAGDIHVAAAPGIAIAEGFASLILADIDQLMGNGRTWLYGASDQSYTWTIDGVRSGRVTSTLVDDANRLLAFENLSAIHGGAHDDIFQVIVATPLLSLDGGSAATADLVDYSRVNGNLSINLAEALTGQNSVITGVEGIRGNNAGPDSLHSAELVGPDGGAIWRIGNFGGPLADGVNDGEVSFGDQTISFLDFSLLTGGAGADTFNQISGVVLGALSGGAGNDTFTIDLVGANAGTRVIGGSGSDTLLLHGGHAAGVLTYTAAANGGEFDYGHEGVHYKVGHQEVEILRDQSLAQTLEIRGSSVAETFALGNGRFQVNDGAQVEHSSKRDIAVRSGINDIIDITENLQVGGSLTLANGTVIANDPANSSVTAQTLILDSVRDVGLASARLRTSVEDLAVRNSAGDIYLQEQNGLNLTEFNANGVFDLLLLNGGLSNRVPMFAADVFRASASSGDITLTGANQLRDDVALTGNRVELHNASTLTLVDVQAQELVLRTQRGIEGDGPIAVSGLTSIDAQGDVLFDFATNDFNRVRVTNAVNLTLVDQNAIELLDINASGAVVVRSTNSVTLSDRVTGATGVTVTSGVGSINQNGSITTSNGAVVVEAGSGQVNLGEDARILANGGSVNISAGVGDVNMGGSTRIVANGGDVTIVAADSVVVAEVVSSGLVTINAGAGGVSDGNGGATNISAGGLQISASTGFGSQDTIETQVGKIDIATNSGNVAVSNTGSVTVDGVSTGQGDISLVNQGDVDLGAGSISAQDGANGGSVDISVSQGSVTQSGSTIVPAVKGTGTVVISAPDGAIGAGGGIRVDAPAVEIIAAIKAGEIFVNPGTDKIEYFSGSFKFDDQLLAIAPLEDINPAIFANVKSYFFNDISLLLPRDQRYEDDEEED